MIKKKINQNSPESGHGGYIPQHNKGHMQQTSGNPLQYSCLENLMDRGVSRLQSIKE